IPASLDADAAKVMRQALAGMLWSKQYYYFDVNRWLEERGCDPYLPSAKKAPRNEHWHHMQNADVISMPDKWEYPWYAAWDLAFHTLALSVVDLDFAKKQLALILNEVYLHPNGQLPAYEWNFSDVNPPVHAWAALFLYRSEQALGGEGDGFFYDLLRRPDGSATRLQVRSMVGLLPLCATTVVEAWQRERVPRATAGLFKRMHQMPELAAAIHPTGVGHLGVEERGI